MCVCVFIYMLLSFANWTIFMYVHAICYVFIVRSLYITDHYFFRKPMGLKQCARTMFTM